MEEPGIWSQLGRVDPDRLIDARLQLHHAVRLTATVGERLLPESDPGRGRLTWHPPRRCLVGAPIELDGAPRFAMALRPFDLMLLLLDGDARAAGHLDLSGHGLDQVWRWLQRAVTDWTGRAVAHRLTPQAGQGPEHPVADGAPFLVGAGGALPELATWLDLADRVLKDEATRRRLEPATWLRSEPLELVLPLPRPPGVVETALCLGDEDEDLPFFLVRPCVARPSETALPGHEGERRRIGDDRVVVLPAEEILAVEDDTLRRQRVRRFLAETTDQLLR
jgi:hypothetical protein